MPGATTDAKLIMIDELKNIQIRIHGIGCLLQQVHELNECWFGLGAVLLDLAERVDNVRQTLERPTP